MKQPLIHEVDLTQIQGEGDFPCPKCGTVISPDDETEDVYQIVDTKIEDQALTELVIQCNKCQGRIRLVGFLTPKITTP